MFFVVLLTGRIITILIDILIDVTKQYFVISGSCEQFYARFLIDFTTKLLKRLLAAYFTVP